MPRHPMKLSQLSKLSLLFSLAVSLWLALPVLPAFAQGPCFVESTGDNTTDFDSADASAVSPGLKTGRVILGLLNWNQAATQFICRL